MLYIRHADKLYKNSKSSEFPLDPGITVDGKNKAKERFKVLLSKYGIPERIISSPYLRARQTAQIAQNVIYESTEQLIPIFYDSNIGEYLGHQKNINLKLGLRPETLNLNPIPHESWRQYKNRIYKYSKSLKLLNNEWFISHGLIIQSIAYFNNYKIKYPSELEGIYINNNNIICI